MRVGLWGKLSAEELMLLNCGVGEDSWESHGLQGDPTSPFWCTSALGFLWREWCWSWNSSTLCYLMWRDDSLEKTLMLGVIGARGEGTTEDEMAGWHHWLDGRESEWTPEVGDGQGGLVCCDSWGRKESDTTSDWNELNWTELRWDNIWCLLGKIQKGTDLKFSFLGISWRSSG